MQEERLEVAAVFVCQCGCSNTAWCEELHKRQACSFLASRCFCCLSSKGYPEGNAVSLGDIRRISCYFFWRRVYKNWRPWQNHPSKKEGEKMKENYFQAFFFFFQKKGFTKRLTRAFQEHYLKLAPNVIRLHIKSRVWAFINTRICTQMKKEWLFIQPDWGALHMSPNLITACVSE